MPNAKFKKWWLNILISLPVVTIGLVVGYINLYSGIDLSLRLYASVSLICAYLAIMLLGFYFVSREIKIGSTIISVLSVLILLYTSYLVYVNMRVYNSLNQMIRTQSEVDYSLVSMANNNLTEVSDLEGMTIATLNLTDDSALDVIYKFLEAEELRDSNQVIMYDSPISMVHDLYRGEVDAMIIGSNFVSLFSDNRGFENIEEETQVLDTFTIVTENNNLNSSSLTEEPFSILLLGTNSMEEGQIDSGQVNTLILTTINLQNLSVTMTSVPRDSYIDVPCINYAKDKLSHTHSAGTMCVVQTVEHLMGVEIPYYAKLNFRGMVSLVDTLGGIEVDVPVTITEQNSRRQFGEHMITVEEGLQRLDGEQALALSRHRKSFLNQDLTRVTHQQLVLKGIVNELLTEVSTVNEMLSILNVLGENMDTNLSIAEITSLAQYILDILPTFANSNPLEEIHIKNMVLSGVDDRVHTSYYAVPLYVIHLYEGAIADARESILINLEQMEPGFNYSFSFNGFNDNHETLWVQPFYNEPLINQWIN